MNTHTSSNQIITHSTERWTDFFNVQAAIAAVGAHVSSLPSSRTPEKHTARVYSSGLRFFMDWAEDRLPDANLMTGYIGHLKARGLKSTTINAKYLTPVRLYLRKLAAQHIPVTGPARDFVQDCKEHIRAAIDVPSPKSDTTTNVAPLWSSQFIRLNLKQVRRVLRSIDRKTLSGVRDYALLLVAFESGLRLAELHRITLASLAESPDGWLITVRGKRSNVDPVPISQKAARAILRYVAEFNAPLEADDPRRIEQDTPVWQPLNRWGSHLKPENYTPSRGMSKQAISNMISRRTGGTLGDEYALAAHDTRRTCAAMAYEAGMDITQIQALLRHKDAVSTLRYVGTKPDYASRSLATYISLT